MSDPITIAARAAAKRLADEYGPGLAVDVEAALHVRETAQRPGQYFDLVSIGSLIVAIATLAWTIYRDQRSKTPEPSHSYVARHVRVELREHSVGSQQDVDHITEIVVTEIVRAAHDPR